MIHFTRCLTGRDQFSGLQQAAEDHIAVDTGTHPVAEFMGQVVLADKELRRQRFQRDIFMVMVTDLRQHLTDQIRFLPFLDGA